MNLERKPCDDIIYDCMSFCSYQEKTTTTTKHKKLVANGIQRSGEPINIKDTILVSSGGAINRGVLIHTRTAAVTGSRTKGGDSTEVGCPVRKLPKHNGPGDIDFTQAIDSTRHDPSVKSIQEKVKKKRG